VGDLVHPDFIAIDPRDAPQLFQREAHARKEYIAEEERLDYDALIEVIMGTIEPDSWMDNGGRGTLSEFPAQRKLIVSQTADFHQQIEQLLSTLRAVAAGNVLSMHIDRHFPRHAEIHRRLQQEISVNWYDLSLQRVAQQLGERLDINVLFDPVGLEEAAVSISDRVTGNLSQGRASTLLRAALPANLDYIVKDGVVLITSRDGMQENLETRVYNVRDLVRLDERGVGGKKGKPKPRFNPWTGEMISRREDYDTLMEVLESNVNPDSWMNNGGKGTVMGFHGMLVVAQTASTHQEIRQMLAALRKPASPLRADYRLYREELWIEQEHIQREFMQAQEAEQPPEEEQATPAEQQGGGGGFF